MSTSKAIRPKRDDASFGKWEPIPERAPSVEVEDRPIIARFVAMAGLFFLVLGTLAMVAPMWSATRGTVIPPTIGFGFATLGLTAILYHVFVERDFQFRRMYGFIGVGLLLGAVVVRLVAFRSTSAIATGNWFMLVGVPALFIGLIVIIAVIRNETEAQFRTLILNLIGIMAAVMIAFGMVRGALVQDYLAVEGVVLLLLGLLYACAYIGMHGAEEDRGHKAALGLGAVGIIGFVVGLVFSLLPPDSITTRVPWTSFFVPSGLTLMGVSLLYVAVAAGIVADWPVVVLTRRELAAYFYSPVAYLVILGQVIFAWVMFWLFFVPELRGDPLRGRPGGVMEPIIISYIVSIIPVFVMMFFVPAITMRLMSEEKRSGTLEVMMTAPVNEVSLVSGKFIAGWIFYMLLWLPWWMFLVSLRYYGNEEFDYRPVFSFMIAQAVISAGFISMGLFFSSLTTNQVIAAVFTFVGMMAHLVLYFAQGHEWFAGNAIGNVFQYVNFVDLWIDSLRGTIAPRYLVFHASVSVFFVFATVKVLESRKWK